MENPKQHQKLKKLFDLILNTIICLVIAYLIFQILDLGKPVSRYNADITQAHESIPLGMPADEVEEILRSIFNDDYQIYRRNLAILVSPPFVFGGNPWALAIQFNDRRRVTAVRIYSQDGQHRPKNAPFDKEAPGLDDPP